MNSSNEIYLYTDASFSKAHTLAVGGWILFRTRAEHEGREPPTFKRTFTFEEGNNIRAEVRAANQALLYIEASRLQEGWIDAEVHLYSDCQTVTELPKRRDKLERTNFVSGRTGKPLVNKDLYQEFFRLFDLITPIVHWLPGHSPKSNQSLEQHHFSFLDKIVRKHLREIIRSQA